MVSPLRPLMVTGTISSLNRPAFCAASALFCEAAANWSCSLAGDLPFLGDVLGGGAHVVAVEGVPQPVVDHGVDQLGVAHLGAVAQMHAVRRLAHALLAAGDDDVGVASPDRLKAERHRAQAGAAELVDADRRSFHGNAGVDRGLAGRVLARFPPSAPGPAPLRTPRPARHPRASALRGSRPRPGNGPAPS